MSHGTASESAELPPPTLEEVSSGIFAYVQLDGSWFLNNAGIIVGDDSAIVIDTLGTEARSRAFHAALRKTTDKPVPVLVNTHSHADHTHGNFLFAPQTAIVAHELCREEVLVANLEFLRRRFPTAKFGNLPKTPAPMVTFAERLNLFAGSLKVELIFMGPAHTTNDVVAWIPERKVLFTGDLAFNGGTPFAMAGSVAGWLDAIPRLRALGAETIVPGHGAVCTPDVFDTIERYLRFIGATARKGFDEGVAPLDLARQTDLGEFGTLTDPERIVGNLHRAYSELSGAVRGAAINGPQAFGDMVAYNGGQPLRCLA